jgi:hypothetical protein
MKPIRLSSVVLLALVAAPVNAAPPTAYTVLDNSSPALMDQATAEGLWKQSTSAKLMRLYPVKKWGFVTEVEGGFDDAKVCVITARAMMLPRSGKTLVYRPAKTATAFGTQAAASQQQCQSLAKAKLNEAIGAVSSALLTQ